MPAHVKLAQGEDPITVILERLATAGAMAPRQVLGLAGGPGAGKSTLAAEIVLALNRTGQGPAVHIPMDGFHMKQEKLDRLGLVLQKGASHTFEASAFVCFLSHLSRSVSDVSGPSYSRTIEDVIEDGYVVPGSARVLVVEGNYLLLDVGPWHELRALFDLAIFLDVPRNTVRWRLLRRHAAEALFTPRHIARHVERVDLPNHDLVRSTRHRADLVIARD